MCLFCYVGMVSVCVCGQVSGSQVLGFFSSFRVQKSEVEEVRFLLPATVWLD